MLTWSDWHTEPRSNRYHYTTKFSCRWPVFFVQTNGKDDAIEFEAIDGADITLVRIGSSHTAEQFARLGAALRERGVTRPLVWVYNLFLAGAIPRLHPALVVYHATEDYVSKPDSVAITLEDLSSRAIATIKQADLVVAVSEGVARSHRGVGDTPVHVLANGCDFEWWETTGASSYQAPDAGNVALFQGGINQRLDYALLAGLADLLPEWEFWFCGKDIDGGSDWARLRRAPNVRYFGLLDSDGIAALARQARVGLIPFKDSGLMRRSLPLKAYEYLACGLPVVTTPIDALAEREELFTTARTAEEFASAVVKLGALRTDPDALRLRREAAHSASYSRRFEELLALLEDGIRRRSRLSPSLNVLMLYDDGSTHVSTIAEHLDAFRLHSRHRFQFFPATGRSFFPGRGGLPDLSGFDAIAIHYSVRTSTVDHLSPAVADMVAAYRGPKLLFVQDEYDQVERTRRYIETLGIDAVFTNVPVESTDFVYPEQRFSHVEFLPTLTGYVPEDPSIDDAVMPMAQREVRIGYRGRTLPHHYGALAREKYDIGLEVRRRALARNLRVDIEVDSDKRIYGSDWYRFIGSARATLGTESGSNVFDFDGRLAELSEKHKDMSFDQFSSMFLREHEGLIRMNQISPKIFESIRLKTALILFEGSYSGVVVPNEHYLPLKKDYSNIEDVFAKIEDVQFLEAMTERAYRDVIASQRYSLRNFVKGVDEYLSRRAFGRRRATIVSSPVAVIYDRDDFDILEDAKKPSLLLSDTVLTPALNRDDIRSLSTALFELRYPPKPKHVFGMDFFDRLSGHGLIGGLLRPIWRLLPLRARLALLKALRSVMAMVRGRG
jgi:glycosyltransferase involved in cell wall biosynthesis